MLVAGSLCVRKRWPYLGRGLMGLGLAILYATFFAAFSLYKVPVMSQPTAFGCMVAVTVAGMALAVLHNALSTAFLAVLGGLLTPVLVSTGVDARDALFTYLLLLDLGVLAVAFFRGWRLLDALAMAGTFVLYFGWYDQFYGEKALAAALAWLGAFYGVFLVLPFLYHLVRKRGFTIERFVMALANAALAFGLAWHMLHEKYSFSLGFVALGMAAAYLVMGSIIRRRLPEDAKSLFGAVALTVTLLTLAVPLQLKADGILLAWAVEGPVLLLLGHRFRYRPVRVLAGVVLLVAIGRLFLSADHWPLHQGLYVVLLNRRFLTAMAVPAAAGLFAVVHHLFRTGAWQVDRGLKIASALAAGLLTLGIVHAETAAWLEREVGRVGGASAVAAWWAVGAGAFLLAGTKARAVAGWTWAAGAGALLAALVQTLILYDLDLGPGHVLAANARFATGLLASLVVFGYAWALLRIPVCRDEVRRPVAAAATALALLVLLALLGAEVRSYCLDTLADAARAGRAARMSVTVVWSAYAACLVVVGFWRRWRAIRLAGLGLFGVSAVKLVLLDLAYLEDIYRIVSFLVLGLLMVAASYLYHRLERRLSPPAPAAGQGADGETP